MTHRNAFQVQKFLQTRIIVAREICPTCGSEISDWNPMTECRCCHRVTCQTCNSAVNIVCPSCKNAGMTLGREVMFL